MLETTILQENLLLLAERAILWQRRSTMFIADPHFGKGASFRSAGLAIPPGSTEADLGRLSSLLEKFGPERLVILGDLFHTRESQSEETLSALGRWREQFREIDILLVPGNHDRHAGAPPRELEFALTEDRVVEAPFVFTHKPASDPEGYVLAGHVHPAIELRDPVAGRMRAACFVFGEEYAILPAFGTFTGKHVLRPEANTRYFLAGSDVVLNVTKALLRE